MRTYLPAVRRRRFAALAAFLSLLLALTACSPAAPADGPGAVVTEALDKVAAKDLDGLRGLACAGQEDLIRDQIGLPAGVGTDLLPGLDTQALLDAVKIDVSAVTLGEPSIDADVAEVPVGGTMKVTFDKEAMRPLLRSLLEAQGASMTDEQIDALLGTLESYGQDVPVDQTVRLIREGGAWKICQASVEVPAAS
jgi:hypothetical protein